MHSKNKIQLRSNTIQMRIGLAACLFALWGCGTNEPDPDAGAKFALPAPLPEMTHATAFAPGVLRSSVALTHNGTQTHLLIFMPDTPASGKRPCILIAPAGTRLFHGSALEDGNPPEYLPYVQEGYIVVAYELDGDLNEHPHDREIVEAAHAFKQADAGLADARLALDYALQKVPNIDSNRIYTAGHSSAATVSLYVAEHEPRIKACIAYAPVCYLEERVPEKLITVLESSMPGYRDYIRRISPSTDVAKLTCPVFIFHADDDSNVPTEQVSRFVTELKKTNKQVTFARVATGDHYQSMIKEGIPQAIQWLKSLPATP